MDGMIRDIVDRNGLIVEAFWIRIVNFLVIGL